MRNLKRALSLGLTAAMISGLMVMGSSAVGYADVTSEQNEEAIEVLQTIGIMIGDEDGNFNPDQNVTRNEMAVIMANLMEYNVATYKDTSPFTDVPAWAEPYVAACYTNGITTGYSATIYGGSDTVTTAQAALMLMKALGYFQFASDFGNDWQLAATKQANDIDLLVGVDSGVQDPMTRNDVAQLVLNTLRSGTVKAETDGNWTIGNVTITNNVKYSYVTSNQSYATAISDVRSTSNTTDAGRSIVELGEQLYMGDLKLNDNAIDDFGRPSRNWNYEGKEIGTYAKTELLKATYTTAVTGREMYDLLTASTINDNDLARYVDGFGVGMDKTDLSRNNKSDLAYTGNGALTEVYLDDDNDEITIATINTYLAQATGDYSEEKEYAPLEVYLGLNNDSHVYNVDVADVEAVADVADEEFYLVNISYADANSLDDDRNAMVAEIASPEVMENSTVTKWSDSVTNVVKKLTVDGTEYNAAVKAFYDEDTLEAYDNDLLTDMSYNLYLDQYGYVIGVDVYEGDLKYVFITGYDRNSSNLSVSTADAGAIFLDGTMDEIKVNVKATNENIDEANDPYYTEWVPGNDNGNPTLNRWYKYSVNESGVYTLKPTDMTATLYNDQLADGSYEDVTINTASLSVKDNVVDGRTRVYGEDESVYITVDTDIVDTRLDREVAITDVDGVYTGVQNVNLEIDTTADTLNTGIEAQVYTVYDKDNYVIGAVVIGDVSGSGDYAYILSNGATSEEKIGDTYYWEFDAILDGQVQTLTAKSKYTEIINTIAANQFEPLELRFDTDDYVVRVLEPEAEDVYDFDLATAIDEPDITDFEVYYIDSNDNADPATAGYDYLELNLQGRTLYITDDQDDYGLAMASDAKAVVIQDEYNKTDVKTEFTTVKAAIAHLADPVDQSTDLEYNGKIFAVLNTNGSAAWIVFDSRTPLVTGNGGIHGDNADWSVYPNKDINAALHVKKVNDWYEATDVNVNRLGNLAYSFTVPGWMTVTDYRWWVEVNGELVDGGVANAGDFNQNNGLERDKVTSQANWISYDVGDRVDVYVTDIHYTADPVVGVVGAGLPALNVEFQDVVPGAAIPGAQEGKQITIEITVPQEATLARSANTVTSLEEGSWYNVYVNNKLADNNPCQFKNGVMTVLYTLTHADMISGKVIITDITPWTGETPETPETPDDPDTPVEPGDETYAITVTGAENATVTYTDAEGNAVDPTAVANGTTVTVTVTANEGFELVGVTGTEGTLTDGTWTGTVSAAATLVVETKEAGTVDPEPETDGSYYATVSGSNITLYSYACTPLSLDQAKEAIAAAVGQGATAAGVNIVAGLTTSNVVVTVGTQSIALNLPTATTEDSGSMAAPKALFKVTIDGEEYYTTADGTVSGLPESITALLAEDTLVGTPVTVSKGVSGNIETPDDPETDGYDVTYVPALELGDKSAFSDYTWSYDKDGTWTALSAATHIQTGVALQMKLTTADADRAGEVISVTVAGKTYTGTVNKDGNLTITTDPITGYAANEEKVSFKLNGTLYTVKVGDETVATGLSAEDVVDLAAYVEDNATYIVGDTAAADAAIKFVGNTKQVLMSGIIAGAEAGVITINKAYEVAHLDNVDFTLSTDKEGAESVADDAAVLVAEGTELYVTASEAATILVPGEESTYTLGESLVQVTNTAEGVWKITVTGDIADDEFVAGLSSVYVPTAGKTLASNNAEAEDTIEIEVTGLKSTTPCTAVWQLGTSSVITNTEVETSISGETLTITITNAEALTADETGKLTVTIGEAGNSIQYVITVTAAAS